MKCPNCSKELVTGERKRYENAVDHAFSPNATHYPLRPAWVCPDGCGGGFYDVVGFGYDHGVSNKYHMALDSSVEKAAIKAAM